MKCRCGQGVNPAIVLAFSSAGGGEIDVHLCVSTTDPELVAIALSLKEHAENLVPDAQTQPAPSVGH